ncbi:MAG: type II toxin-antitoxin system HicB family antitoxin [Calditrichaeota bacterium]|nr:type II toxin-antitoxin system HicB family antitoxin [Calditrichota bacterium]
MPTDFHIIFEKDDDWFIGYCPEVPGANGQGRTEAECRQNVLEAVELVLQYRLEQASQVF